jgi:hypothetical protein
VSARVPVTEATVEFRPDGTLRYRYYEVPGGRDRSQPPSLREFIAALSKVRKRSMTVEEHRALLELLAACGHITLPARRGDGAAPQGDTSGAGKATHSRGQSDTLTPQGDGSDRKATLLGVKATVSG